MPRIAYGPEKRLGPRTLAVVRAANAIIEEYAAQGFVLTLRQLYYQFVARGLLPNRQGEYKRLGSIVNDARYAGLVDWSAIVDRTRALRALSHWESPGDIVEAAARSYRRDLWATQPYYVEVWIEKDALVGVIQPTCERLDVPYFSCRGYTSASEVWAAAQRIGTHVQLGQRARVLHLGDHDPSGIDMTRDITERLATFVFGDLLRDEWFEGETDEERIEAAREALLGPDPLFDVDRLALSMEQVETYGPPPNPAKLTDSRAGAYVEQYGFESWELDALEPTVLAGLIEDAVGELRDADAWADATEQQDRERAELREAARRWSER